MAKNKTKLGKGASELAFGVPAQVGKTVGSVLTLGMLFGKKPKRK